MSSILLVFRHGPEQLAVPLDEVREVTRMVLPRGLPGAPEFVLGVMDLRGQLIPVVDMNALLRAHAKKPGVDHHLIVLRVRDMDVAFIVTRVDDVVTLDDEMRHDLAGIVPEWVPFSAVIRGVEGPLPILDPARLLAAEEVRSLQDALDQIAEAMA